jgi:Tol biopolymer transport system component
LGENLADSKVVVVNVDGTNPQVLGDGCMPNFSPRAQRIVYSRYGQNQGVWGMNVADQEAFLIDKDGWGAQWSPDGKRIVYSTNGPGAPNLIVTDIVEGTRERLFDAATSNYRSYTWNSKWSPDGRKIVFRGERSDGQVEVGIVDASGAKNGLVTRFVGKVSSNFAWRPDGKRLLFSYPKTADDPIQVYSVDPDKNDPPERLPGLDSTRSITVGSFSPDGKKIAIVCAKPTQPKKDEKKGP